MRFRTLVCLALAASYVHSQSVPDLLIGSVSATVNTDPQTLAASGSLSVLVRNAGAASTGTGYQLAAFEDRNNNGIYDAATDNLLGIANATAPLAAGASVNVIVPVSGSLLFRGNIIYVFADANNAILENNEVNNLRHSGQSGTFLGPADTSLNPVIAWEATTFTELPDSRASLGTPSVGDVNGDGVPDVVFSTYLTGSRANLRVASGDTGAILFTVTDPNLEVSPSASTSLADIDADGRPELITIDALGRLMVLEHDGTLKWRNTTNLVAGSWTGPMVADLDRNGTPEIIVGRAVYSATGTRLWQGTGGQGLGFGGLLASVAADLDLDGNLEVIAGPTAYRADGTILWNKLGTPATLLDGPTSVANFDEDPYPEILIRCNNNNYLYMLEHDGTVKWAVNPAVHQTWGGRPVIGNLDADPEPEFTIVDRVNLIAYEANGSIKWILPITETTSGVTSAAIFDLNNDGLGEVVYADQTKLFFLRGTTGTILNQFARYSGTAGEGPAIADINKDGHADVVITGDVPSLPEGRGIRVYSGANLNWANTRNVWNQDAYTVTNINDNLTVPVNPQPNWLAPGLNNFRTNGFLPGSGPQSNSASDATVSLLRRLDTSFPASTSLIARIGSGGSLPLPVNRVEFRNGPGGPLLGAVNTSRALAPGEYEDVSIVWTAPPAGQINLVVTADTANAINESDETNNQHATQLVIGQGPYVTVDDLIPRAKDSGADLKWTPISGAVSYNIYRRTGGGAQERIRSAYVTSTGAYSDQPLTNNTLYRYEVRWLNGQGVESQIGTESSVQPIPRTQRGDTPPSILSTPSTRGRTQVAFQYVPNVADPDPGETLSWQLTGAPSGLTLNPSNGRIDWLPGAGQGGSYRMTLTVTDSRARIASQAFTLFIETQIVNTAPVTLSTPITSAAVGSLYSYLVRAADSDAGDVLTYLLDSGPAGMTINSSTGLLQWTPAAAGTFPVAVRVRDLANATVTQTFQIVSQNANRGPVITSTPVANGTANAAYTYPATASDPDSGDSFNWRLLTGPTGMSVHPSTGLVYWNPTVSQVGTHPITIEVADRIGATARQSYVLTIVNGTGGGNTPPIITSTPFLTGRVGSAYAYDVNAIDLEGQPVTFALSAAPTGALIDPVSGLISWIPNSAQAGPNAFTVVARDSLNASGSQSFTVEVSLTPLVEFTLHSPAAGADLTRPVNVVASITDPNPGGAPITWSVRLRKPGMTERLLASGSGLLNNAPIAAIDPTLLPNDSYTLYVEIVKGAELIFREIPYSVSGDAKLGHFSISETDLTLSVGGLPLTVARHYDSLDTRIGDFGAGWRLATFGSVQDAPRESPFEAMRPGSKVYVTLPNGKRAGFRFDPVATSVLFPYVVSPRFTADPGVFDKLEVTDTSVFLFDGAAYATFNDYWNPQLYILTTTEGVRYEIDENAGVKFIRDRNGNTLTFTPAAVVSSTGPQLTLTRDASNRITAVRDPGGAEVRYAYDAAGNLSTVTDPLGNVKRFFYENVTFPNFLTRVQDPLGRAFVRNVYDSTGRLTATCPPAGDITTLAGCVQITTDSAALTETIFNGRGFRRDYVYDGVGNLILERRFLDGTTFRDTARTYDAAGNLLSVVDPAGNLMSFTYDSAGNVTSATRPGGLTLRATWLGSCNKIATVTDEEGGITNFTYDSNCNLRFARDRAGNTTEYRYDSAGRVTHLIDPSGSTTTWSYNPQGLPATTRDPRGNTSTMTWSSSGDLQTVTDRNGRRIDYQYDAMHRRIRETWSDGKVFNYAFDSAGYPISGSDGTTSTAFVYDALGRRTRETTNYAGSVTAYTIDSVFDANNNRTSVSDSLVTTMQYTYNSLDQLVTLAQTGNGLNAKRVEWTYDLANLPSSMVRFNAFNGGSAIARTGFEFACGGCADRLSALQHSNGAGNLALHWMTYTRNRMGDILQATDRDGLHSYGYDGARRLISAAHPGTVAPPLEAYSYDAAGNRLTSHLSAAHQYSYQTGAGGNLLTADDRWNYSYDPSGNLIRKQNRTDGSTVNYEYDFRNRVTAIITRNSSNAETGRVRFGYDTFNRRFSQTTSAGETRFYYDGLNPIAAVAPGNVVTKRLYGPGIDRVLSEDTAGVTRWVLTDAVGTVRTLLDATGAVQTHLTTDSFGRPLGSTNAAETSQLSFAGREGIDLSGDHYFRSRLYDSSTGRFLQEDPIQPFGYSYAEASPLVQTDPLGLVAAIEYVNLEQRGVNQVIDVLCKIGSEVGGILYTGTVALGQQFGGSTSGFQSMAAGGQLACAAWNFKNTVQSYTSPPSPLSLSIQIGGMIVSSWPPMPPP